MSDEMSKSDRLRSLLDRYPSVAKFQLFRNLCLGAGGTILLILLVIFQSEGQSFALTLVKVSGAASMPFWFTSAALIEYYIWIGPRSYPHYRKVASNSAFTWLFFLGAVGFIISIGGFLYELGAVVLYAFIASVFLCMLIAVSHQEALAQSIFSESDGEDESNQNDT